MAVEAKQLNFLTPQLIQRSEQRQMLFSGISAAATLPENHMSFYQPVICEAKTSGNTDRDSGLTYNNLIPPTRKRSRQEFYAAPNFSATQKNVNGVSHISSFIGEDIFQQHHLDIDSIISQHSKRIRMEIQEVQKQQSRLLMAAIGEGAMKKLKEKDEQIQEIGKLNYVLEERVKSLFVENQLWRDIAKTSEATAITLRANLEQALAAHVRGDRRVTAVEDDVESCCGSSDHGGGNHNVGGDEEEDRDVTKGDGRRSCYGDRGCRKCGEREACVLLLPCRHLCLCNVCGSGAHQLRACPVCHASMNATLHVNMSS